MNDFLYAHKKTIKSSDSLTLTVFLDADLKKNTLSILRFEGNLCSRYQSEIDQIVESFLHQKLDIIPKISLKNSLPLGLFYAALDEYQGHVPVVKNNCDDLVCLCFGVTQKELNTKVPTMAGRACGGCLTFIRPREFKKIAGMYPGPLVVVLDQLKTEWAKDKDVKISLEAIDGDRLEVLISPYEKEKLQSLSDYFLSKLNTRFFLRATL